jgi:flagellar hook assembly protein FlgD
MAVSPIGSASTSASKGADMDQFRNADFLKIMLSELSQQDPFKPQETSKIVENMQKLQDLANTQFQKFRDDQRWAQDLVGKDVSARQMSLTAPQRQALVAKGLNPDVGYANVTGSVDSFRVVDQTVYVHIKDKDYDIGNVTQVNPSGASAQYLAEISRSVLARQVSYTGPDAESTGAGIVSSVSNRDGKVMLTVNGKQVPFEYLTKISLPL